MTSTTKQMRPHGKGEGWPLEGVDCRAPENTTAKRCQFQVIIALILIELKLCNVITCIGGKTGGDVGENWGPGPRPQPRIASACPPTRSVAYPRLIVTVTLTLTPRYRNPDYQ